MARHRNLIREHADADARQRAERGESPRTQAEWAAFVNGERPRNAQPIAESTWARYVSPTRGVCRCVERSRRWVLEVLGLDYGTYVDAWGDGPAEAHGRGETDADSKRVASSRKAVRRAV